MQDKNLFRKAAIEKLSSPEQLDALAEVTSPRGWLALYTVGGMLAGTLLWGIYGSVPTRVDGEGILIRGGGLQEIYATGNGILSELKVTVGDSVQQGQTVAAINQPNLDDRIRGAEEQYRQLLQDYELAEAETAATIAGHRADIRRTRAELRKVEEELVAKRESFEKGLITRNRLLALERDQVNLQSNITRLEAVIRQLEQRLRQQKLQVEAAEREWKELMSAGARLAEVKSTVSGRVIEIKKTPGDQVAAGEILAILEPFSGALEPVAYVVATQGKLIQPGMEAQISPYTVKREEYGYMKGVISKVGQFPVTPSAAMAVVANEQLVQELLGREAKIEVRASLIPDPSTPSGFAWSSSEGPPFHIASGTRVRISVVVDRRPPITFVLPIIRSSLGIS